MRLVTRTPGWETLWSFSMIGILKFFGTNGRITVVNMSQYIGAVDNGAFGAKDVLVSGVKGKVVSSRWLLCCLTITSKSVGPLLLVMASTRLSMSATLFSSPSTCRISVLYSLMKLRYHCWVRLARSGRCRNALVIYAELTNEKVVLEILHGFVHRLQLLVVNAYFLLWCTQFTREVR